MGSWSVVGGRRRLLSAHRRSAASASSATSATLATSAGAGVAGLRQRWKGGAAGGATSFHYFEQRNYASSREFGDEPHHSWDLEHDALQVCGPGWTLLSCPTFGFGFNRKTG